MKPECRQRSKQPPALAIEDEQPLDERLDLVERRIEAHHVENGFANGGRQLGTRSRGA